jgi:type IV pilus assembly protein PilA
MLKRLRERAGSESGFTLIELLVVMLILGILAAIAIPAFLNQKNKATDSQAKANARTMQTAMETWSTDHSGVYNNPVPTITDLNKIEPTIPTTAGNQVTSASATGYVLQARSTTGNNYLITRTGGTFTHTCNVPNANADHGGCTITGNGTSGTW